MTRDLRRLLSPRSIAVIGGGAWCAQVIRQARAFGFAGPIWPVHPKATEVEGLPASRNLSALPEPPDAAFIGINRYAAIDAAAELAAMGAGGAVCFASGFAEATAEDADAGSLQARLVAAAGEMPILGPNCYGFVNALDGALLWPDQHGCTRQERGIAVLTQSSNIAINITMARRALPLAFIGACGNMAQISQARLAMALLDDPRITAIGLHIEGFGDLREWEALAARAAVRGVPLVALKMGASDQARHATLSHTASLAGSDAGAQALLDRLGIARLRDLPSFLETLKLLHATGRLESRRLSSISCSGGEASLVADQGLAAGLSFPPLLPDQRQALSQVLGPMVALANPIDYHTYIWRDTDAMSRVWAAMASGEGALTLSIVDYPHTDASDWECATIAAIGAREMTGRPFAVVATLPELMPEDTAGRLMAAGVVPLYGLSEALAAIAAAALPVPDAADPLILPGATEGAPATADEATAKAALAGCGMPVPLGRTVRTSEAMEAALAVLGAPLAMKRLGDAHKSDNGGVALMLDADAARHAARAMKGPVLVEEMVTGGVAELLVGVTRDPAHGFVLTLGAGGVMTELWQDTQSLLVPAGRASVRAALDRLRIAPLLAGYRGKPAADIEAILDAIDALQAFVARHADRLTEVEVNPLICTPDRAVAADALLSWTPPEACVTNLKADEGAETA